jgi:hypothetical protein
MRAWQRNAAVAAITIFVPLLSEHALAQNLLTNPNFDSSLDGWGYFPLPPPPPGVAQVFWTNTFDHDTEGTGAGGSIHLNTSAAESFAEQCVPVNVGETYSASVWVYSTCVGARFYVFWATQDDCKDTGDFDAVNVRTTKANVWEQVSLSAIPPTTSMKEADKAVVTLVNPGGCGDGAYFDDVFFGPEKIFSDNFEGKALR